MRSLEVVDRRSRPRTRLPYPREQTIRRLLIDSTFELLGAIGRPAFRRSINLSQLSRARILILKPCCLGDVVFATPLVRELRLALPDARITFGVGRHSRPAIDNSPHLDDVLETDPIGGGKYGWSDFLSLARQLRRRDFEACFVLERSAIIGLLPLVAGIPARIGINSGGRGLGHGVSVSARPSRPESEMYLDLLRAIGGKPSSGLLEYHPSDAAIDKIDRLVHERFPVARPFVIFHCAGGINPGMALTRKRWPIERYIELAQRISQTGAAVVLVGAPDDRPVVGALHQAFDQSSDILIDLIGALNLDEVAALARQARVYVGNDSGPSHLVEAAGARVVMLFGPSDSIVYGPRSPRAVPITAGLWCSPCFVDGHFPPCGNVLCMPSITVDRVWTEVAPLLASIPPQ